MSLIFQTITILDKQRTSLCSVEQSAQQSALVIILMENRSTKSTVKIVPFITHDDADSVKAGRCTYTQGGHKLRFFTGRNAQFVAVGIINAAYFTAEVVSAGGAVEVGGKARFGGWDVKHM